MNEVIVNFLVLLPCYGEVAFDWLMWKNGKNDKPISTYVVRPVLFLGTVYLLWTTEGKELWKVSFLVLSAFLAFFPLFINWVRKKDICYTGQNPYDKIVAKIPCMARLWLFIWIYIVALCCYYYNSWF